jgi:hypothetical protein
VSSEEKLGGGSFQRTFGARVRFVDLIPVAVTTGYLL